MKLKKKVKRLILFVIILLMIFIAFLLYQMFGQKQSSAKEVVIINEIKEYGYTLQDDDSKEYKEMFNELKKILEKEEVDEEAYVQQISKMFIKDFYTLNNKDAKTDIGGKMFVHSSAVENFSLKAENTIYKYVENNLYGTRDQKLPEVDEITIENIENVSYDYQDSIDEEAYQVDVSWTYVEDLGYQEKATLIFVHEDKKLSLIKIEE